MTRYAQGLAQGQIMGALSVLLAWIFLEAIDGPVNPWMCLGPVAINAYRLIQHEYREMTK